MAVGTRGDTALIAAILNLHILLEKVVVIDNRSVITTSAVSGTDRWLKVIAVDRYYEDVITLVADI